MHAKYRSKQNKWRHSKKSRTSRCVIPAKAGIHSFQIVKKTWIPFFKGMTTFCSDVINDLLAFYSRQHPKSPKPSKIQTSSDSQKEQGEDERTENNGFLKYASRKTPLLWLGIGQSDSARFRRCKKLQIPVEKPYISRIQARRNTP